MESFVDFLKDIAVKGMGYDYADANKNTTLQEELLGDRVIDHYRSEHDFSKKDCVTCDALNMAACDMALGKNLLTGGKSCS